MAEGSRERGEDSPNLQQDRKGQRGSVAASYGLDNMEFRSRRKNTARSRGGWRHPVPSSESKRAARELGQKPGREGESACKTRLESSNSSPRSSGSPDSPFPFSLRRGDRMG